VARFNDLACVLRSALSFGMSGFPFYSHDIGGFSGIPSPELYVRWAQFGLFSSHARCHGEPPREPGAYGEQAETIFRQYTELRYRLMPYIYSQAVECGRTSLPMVRALVLEFQDDPVAAMITDQYMFGRHILVAPILDETNTRRVYLPSGTWMDYWTKDTLQGPCWLSIEASLDILPLYIQSGAILPFGPLSQFVDEKPLDPLTLEIYTPSSRGEFTIFDPNLPELEVNYDFDGHSLRLETSQTPGLVDVILYGVEIVGVHVDGIDLPFKKTGIGGWEFRFDGRTTAGIEVIVKEN